MTAGLFLKLFPPPRYLQMRGTGLDISDGSIKYCNLKSTGETFAIERWGEVPLPPGVVEQGQIKNKPALTTTLAKLRVEVGLDNVIASLPEEQAYLVKLSLPTLPRHDLRQSIELQLEEHVPLPIERLIFDYETLREPTASRGGYDLVVSVFPKAAAMDYLEVITAAGLVLTSLEIEVQAMARSLVDRAELRPVLVVDFGKTRTGLFIVSGGRVLATSTVATIGGELLTTAIQKNLGLNYEVAERQKIDRGLLQTPGDNRLLFALAPVISVLRDEVSKFASFWDTHRELDQSERLGALLLCGGQSTLPGLVEYLSDSLGVPVRLGSVWTNLVGQLQNVPPLSRNDSLKYATAIGLALKNFHRHD